MIRVGINGLGRVGRAYLRYASGCDDLEVVAVNDVADVTTLARLIRRDSTFGPFRREVIVAADDLLLVDGRKIAVTSIGETGRSFPGPNTASTSSSRPPASSAPATGGRTPGRRRVTGDHLRPGQGRRRDHRHGRQRLDVRRRAALRRLERFLHDQLRRADGQGAARRLRHRTGLHDDRARLHQRPEHPGRSAQGRAARSGGRGQHHSDDHRCRQGGR